MSALADRPARAAWEALGTSAVLVLADGRPPAAARTIVERELERIDWACSRFRADSELSRLNAGAGGFVAIDPLLLEAVELGLRAARITDGDVDPTVGVALELAGYDRDFALLAPTIRSSDNPESSLYKPEPSRYEPEPSRYAPESSPNTPEPTRHQREPALTRAPAVPRLRAHVRRGWEAVAVDRARCSIRVPRGVKLDLGATAKAWAADRASRAVYDATGCGALVSLGGDISTCGPAPRGGWRIHVTDDHRAGANAPGQRVTIYDGGLATSSVTARRWSRSGEAMHHIIDPGTGVPARGPWRTASVAAIDCADANIASTAALVRGEAAPEWLLSLGVPARLVGHDGEVLEIGGWPADAREADKGCTAATVAGRGQEAGNTNPNVGSWRESD